MKRFAGFIILSIFFVLASSSRLFAQNISAGPTIEFSIGRGEGSVYSDFYEKSKNKKFLSLWHTEIVFTEDNYSVSFGTGFNPDSSDIELSAYGHAFKIGLVRSGVGFIGNQFGLKENLFESNSLAITGKTLKQFGVFVLETGVGKYSGNYFRIGALAGGIRIRDDAFFLINGSVVNSDNTKYNEDSLAVYGQEFRLVIVPIKFFKIGVSGYSFSPTPIDNKQGLIAERYSKLKGEIYVFPIKRVGILARANTSRGSREVFSTDNYISVHMVIKLKNP